MQFWHQLDRKKCWKWCSSLVSYNFNTHNKPVLELNEAGLQNTINTAKWFKHITPFTRHSFNSTHITSNGYKNANWVTKKPVNLKRPLHTLTYRHSPIYAILIKLKKNLSTIFEVCAKFSLVMETDWDVSGWRILPGDNTGGGVVMLRPIRSLTCVNTHTYIYTYIHTNKHTYVCSIRTSKKDCLKPDLLKRNFYVRWGVFAQFRLYPPECTTNLVFINADWEIISLFISTKFFRQGLLSNTHTHALWHDTYVSTIHLNHNHYKWNACYRQRNKGVHIAVATADS